jgi:HlyD family secretion protein
VQIARAQLEKARALLQQAQAAYDQVKHLPNIGALPQSLQLQQATLDIQIAEANYRLATAGPTEAQKAAALAQVAQAQAQLDRLKAGASAEEIAIAEAQVRQAEVQVAQARLALENTRLLAPVGGVVVSVNIKVGEFPSAARPAVILNDDSRFHIDVNVDEIDVRSVAVGQPVTVTLDALPDARLTGRVTYVAPAATQEMGVVSYLVTVVLDPTTEPLRAGMSATASITVAEKRDALVVPNRAIQIDRATGKAYVEKVVNGMPTRTEIRLGMRNETQSQVLEGLQEGDVIAIRNASQRERLQQLFFGG